MGMLIKDHGIQKAQDADRDGDIKGDIDPSPHFGHIFFVTMRLRLGQLLLVIDTCTNLFNGFLLHFGLGPQVGDGLRTAALDRERHGAAGSQTRGDTERLQNWNRTNKEIPLVQIGKEAYLRRLQGDIYLVVVFPTDFTPSRTGRKRQQSTVKATGVASTKSNTGTHHRQVVFINAEFVPIASQNLLRNPESKRDVSLRKIYLDSDISGYRPKISQRIAGHSPTFAADATLLHEPTMEDENNFFAQPPADDTPADIEEEPIILGGEAPPVENEFESDFGVPPEQPDDQQPTYLGDVNEAGGEDQPIVLGPSGSEEPPEVLESSEPGPMQKWNAEWQETLKVRKDQENARKAEFLEESKLAMEQFHTERERKREAKMAKNREDEQAKLEAIEADLENDNSWQHVCKLIELSHDSTAKAQDVKRMRDVMILLKNEPAKAEALSV